MGDSSLWANDRIAEIAQMFSTHRERVSPHFEDFIAS
jgi:hypothetical protein